MEERAELTPAVARARLEQIEAERQRVLALVARMEGAGERGAAKWALDAQVVTLDEARAQAHTALGRALLEQYERDIAALMAPLPHRPLTGEMRERVQFIYTACLAILRQWPELKDEAACRLGRVMGVRRTLDG